MDNARSVYNSLLTLLTAVLTYFAIYSDVFGKLPVVTLETGIVFVAIAFAYYRYGHLCAKNKETATLSLFFSVCMVLGRAYDKKDTFFILFSSKGEMAASFFTISGFFVLFYFCLCMIEKAALTVILSREITSLSNKDKMKYGGIILLCWLPVLIAFLPGSFDHDSFAQLLFWTGEEHWTTHHPVISTIYLGLIMDLGKYVLHNVNAGTFLYIFIQTIFCIYAILKMIGMIQKLGIPLYGIYMTFFFFSVVPIWSGYVQCTIKDGMHFIFYIMYSIFLIEMMLDPSWLHHWSNRVKFLLSVFGIFSFRNTGIYLFLLSFVPFAVYSIYKNKKYKCFWKDYTLICATVIFVHFSFMNILVPFMGIRKGSVAEMLSIPFQQTARYVKKHPHDITVEEYNAVNEVLPVKRLPEIYDSQISDPVKFSMKKNHANKIKKYFKAWLFMGLRHPGTYLDATISSTYDYFYPDGFSKARKTGLKLYIKDKNDKNSPNRGTYDVTYIQSESIRKKVTRYMLGSWRKIPVMGLCYNTGIYTWISLVCLMLLAKKKKIYALFAFLPSAATLLFCIASPVNGYIRYMLPIIATMPLMISWTIYSLNKKANE